VGSQAVMSSRHKHSPFIQPLVQQMRPLAAMFLCFPAGESYCEREYSYTGKIVTKLHHSISPQHLEDMVITNCWARSSSYSKEKLFANVQKLMNEK